MTDKIRSREVHTFFMEQWQVEQAIAPKLHHVYEGILGLLEPIWLEHE